jgi:hypothetical protein
MLVGLLYVYATIVSSKTEETNIYEINNFLVIKKPHNSLKKSMVMVFGNKSHSKMNTKT